MGIEILSGPAAAAAVAGEASNLLLYGGPGVGKTTQACDAFYRDGQFTCFAVVCEEGALKPILVKYGHVPDHTTTIIRGWTPLWECVIHVASNRNKYNAMIVDNLTAWTAGTEAELKAAGYGKTNGWQVPIMIRDMLTAFRDACRRLGVHVIYIAHSRDPYTEEGVFYQGGPAMNPKKASNLFYGAVDTMLRAEVMNIQGKATRVYYTGGLEWDMGMLGLPPPSWLQFFQKNREGVAQAVVPADLGAYLRARKPPFQGL